MIPASEILDTRGSLCPQPIIDLSRRMKELSVGTELAVISDDAAFPLDFEAWCAGYRHEMLGVTSEGRIHTGRVRKSH